LFYSYHGYSKTLTDITNVRFFETKEYYTVEITTHRPGIVIGKGGRDIDELEKYLNDDCFNKPVKILLLECQLWLKLYSPN